jgi:hypothetical protein
VTDEYVPPFGTVVLKIETKDRSFLVTDKVGDPEDLRAALDRAAGKLLGEFVRAWANP